MRRLRIAHVANVADRVVNVAINGDQVERAVEIVIGKCAAEAQRCFRGQPDATLHGNVRKITTRIRAVKPDHLVIKIGNRNSGPSGVVEVPNVHAHAGARLAFGAESDSRFDGDIFECAVTLIAIQLVWLRIICDQQIGPAVVVVVEHGGAQ